MGGRALACVAALLLGCASSRPQEALVEVRLETITGEPLEAALRRLDPAGAPVGAVVTTDKPPLRIPAHVPRALSFRTLAPCYVSLVLGERVLDTMLAAGPTVVTFRVDPQEILRAMPTVHVRFVPPPDADADPQLVSAATWQSAWKSQLLDVRSGSCQIPRAVPGEGLLVVSGPYALAMMRIEVQGSADIHLDVPLTRPSAVSGRVEVPPMTDPKCDVCVLPLDGGFPPPPLGFTLKGPVDRDGAFRFGTGPRGRQVLLALKPGYGIGWAEVDNTKGPVESVVIRLQPGVHVTLKTELTGIDAPYVQVETEAGIPLFARLLIFEKHKPPVLTLAEGRYVLRHRTSAREWRNQPLVVGREPVVVWIR